MVNDEYEEIEDDADIPMLRTALRIEGGQPCPEEGFYFSPAPENSHRRFKQGEIMPDSNSAYGKTSWQWDPQQE